MRAYRKMRLRPRVWAALLCISFAIGILCGVSCEQLSNETPPNSENLIVTAETVDEQANILPRYDYAGQFKITHYCACAKCCGQWANGITASGAPAVEGVTIAADTNILPFGTVVMIAGQEYTVQDTGSAIKGNRIDIYLQSHADALAQGVKMQDVYIIN